MKLHELVKIVLQEQGNGFRPIPIDITIYNGNIFLRSFQVHEFDANTKVITGLTQQEAYSYVREGREPVFCKLKISDIKEAVCRDLGLEFSLEMKMELRMATA